MKKEELIEELNEQKKTKRREYFNMPEGRERAIIVSRVNGLLQALELIEQLEEPELPVIPQFVADWIEEHDNIVPVSKIRVLWQGWQTRTLENELLNYFNSNADVVMRAILDDNYTIEKEPAYTVKLGKGYFGGYNELKVTLILNDQPGCMDDVIIYSDKKDALKIAEEIGGKVEEVIE